MTARARRSLLPLAATALILAVTPLGGCSSTGGTGPASTGPASTSPASVGGSPAGSPARPAGPYAAPLPRPLLLAQGVSSANPEHLFRSQTWDFTRMRVVFDAVSLMPGDQATVQRARRAGLAVVLEFDYKADFFAGKDISGKVQAVVKQIRSHPRTISAIHVADRLNQDYNPRQGLRYLAATGGVFHREVPGVPVLVNVADRELTCGMPGQSSCVNFDPLYRFESNATLDAFKRSGYLDGFTVADNVKNNDAAVQVRAWRAARARWPSPFILWSTCSQMSFPGARQPGGPQAAAALVAAYMTGPVRGGAEGLALWAWHQLYDGSIYTFLNKNGSSNDLWRAMAATSARLGVERGPGPPAG
jgi:hypothetical protein